MSFFIRREAVLEEFYMLKDLGNKELPYKPRHYKLYKELLTGKALEIVQALEQEEKPFKFLQTLIDYIMPSTLNKTTNKQVTRI